MYQQQPPYNQQMWEQPAQQYGMENTGYNQQTMGNHPQHQDFQHQSTSHNQYGQMNNQFGGYNQQQGNMSQNQFNYQQQQRQQQHQQPMQQDQGWGQQSQQRLGWEQHQQQNQGWDQQPQRNQGWNQQVQQSHDWEQQSQQNQGWGQQSRKENTWNTGNAQENVSASGSQGWMEKPQRQQQQWQPQNGQPNMTRNNTHNMPNQDAFYQEQSNQQQYSNQHQQQNYNQGNPLSYQNQFQNQSFHNQQNFQNQPPLPKDEPTSKRPPPPNRSQPPLPSATSSQPSYQPPLPPQPDENEPKPPPPLMNEENMYDSFSQSNYNESYGHNDGYSNSNFDKYNATNSQWNSHHQQTYEKAPVESWQHHQNQEGNSHPDNLRGDFQPENLQGNYGEQYQQSTGSPFKPPIKGHFHKVPHTTQEETETFLDQSHQGNSSLHKMPFGFRKEEQNFSPRHGQQGPFRQPLNQGAPRQPAPRQPAPRQPIPQVSHGTANQPSSHQSSIRQSVPQGKTHQPIPHNIPQQSSPRIALRQSPRQITHPANTQAISHKPTPQDIQKQSGVHSIQRAGSKVIQRQPVPNDQVHQQSKRQIPNQLAQSTEDDTRQWIREPTTTDNKSVEKEQKELKQTTSESPSVSTKADEGGQHATTDKEESLESLNKQLQTLESQIKQYQEEYKKWHSDFVKWQKQHQNHPDQKQYIEYQKKYQNMIEEQQGLLKKQYTELQLKIASRKAEQKAAGAAKIAALNLGWKTVQKPSENSNTSIGESRPSLSSATTMQSSQAKKTVESVGTNKPIQQAKPNTSIASQPQVISSAPPVEKPVNASNPTPVSTKMPASQASRIPPSQGNNMSSPQPNRMSSTQMNVSNTEPVQKPFNPNAMFRRPANEYGPSRCKFFPRCKHGKECKFLHDNCAAMARCVDPECPYEHPVSRDLMAVERNTGIASARGYIPPASKSDKTKSSNGAGSFGIAGTVDTLKSAVDQTETNRKREHDANSSSVAPDTKVPKQDNTDITKALPPGIVRNTQSVNQQAVSEKEDAHPFDTLPTSVSDVSRRKPLEQLPMEDRTVVDDRGIPIDNRETDLHFNRFPSLNDRRISAVGDRRLPPPDGGRLPPEDHQMVPPRDVGRLPPEDDQMLAPRDGGRLPPPHDRLPPFVDDRRLPFDDRRFHPDDRRLPFEERGVPPVDDRRIPPIDRLYDERVDAYRDSRLPPFDGQPGRPPYDDLRPHRFDERMAIDEDLIARRDYERPIPVDDTSHRAYIERFRQLTSFPEDRYLDRALPPRLDERLRDPYARPLSPPHRAPFYERDRLYTRDSYFSPAPPKDQPVTIDYGHKRVDEGYKRPPGAEIEKALERERYEKPSDHRERRSDYRVDDDAGDRCERSSSRQRDEQGERYSRERRRENDRHDTDRYYHEQRDESRHSRREHSGRTREYDDRYYDRHEDKYHDRHDSTRRSDHRSSGSALPEVELKHEVVSATDLLDIPGRKSRPKNIVIILRGIPGSGKSFIAKIIKDKEVSNGAQTPRILSLDDYFIQEVEVKDEKGKTLPEKKMEYIYEAELEENYRTNLLKAFNKTLSDGFFPMVIIDSINNLNKHYDQFWSDAKHKGFEVYIAELKGDMDECLNRSLHKRSKDEVEEMLKKWENPPVYYKLLDVSTLLQDASIKDVEMGEALEGEKVNEEIHITDEEDEIDDLPSTFHIPKSKWESTKEETLAKLDGFMKRKSEKKTQSPIYPEDDDDEDDDPYGEKEADMRLGKKRVRWADLEEKKQIEHQRKIGFTIGMDWKILTDPYAKIPR